MTSKMSKPKMTQYGCVWWSDLYEHNSPFLIYMDANRVQGPEE